MRTSFWFSAVFAHFFCALLFAHFFFFALVSGNFLESSRKLSRALLKVSRKFPGLRRRPLEALGAQAYYSPMPEEEGWTGVFQPERRAVLQPEGTRDFWSTTRKSARRAARPGGRRGAALRAGQPSLLAGRPGRARQRSPSRTNHNINDTRFRLGSTCV